MPRLLNPKPKSNTTRVTFHLRNEMLKQLEKQADYNKQNISQIIRAAIDKYMNVDLYKDDTEFIASVVQPIVKDEIGKQANRLAAMLFKIGIITAGNYFLAVRMMSDVISPSMMEDFNDINANARKLGIDYMNQKVAGVLSFLENDEEIKKAAEKLKTDWSKPDW